MITDFLQQIMSLFGNNGSNDNSVLNGAINNSEGTDYGYGLRENKTQKGLGYFGEIPTKDENFMTELGSQITEDKGEFHFPLIVPTLTREEIDHLSSGKEATEEIWQKAIEHAEMRRAKGLDPFATKEEEGKTTIPEYLKR